MSDNYDRAEALSRDLQAMDAEPEWSVIKITNPCPSVWPGQWFRFKHCDGHSWGTAHETMLASYVGKATADRAIFKMA